MGDIQRNDGYEIVLRTPSLKAHSLKIQISEKLNLIKQLAVRLEHIEHVEIEQVKLQMATTSKEVDQLKADLEKLQPIDVKEQ